ncbi:GNAT family N-acetyltransferase [Nocardioides sp.]|uniref:GNAT family N-acetyltransferase n=1 Tax=Nocardioides sp. TaxID=35761 RepID=UPI00273385E9|nr:GNAT family N-acetyltransferase [Nocardioides sp.]MDP3890591.1 GNAT family N-acetyltransferase [Nocardioides sp.]
MTTESQTLSIQPVTPERWDDLAELFERPGPRGGRQDSANCWCSVWRCTQGDPTTNRQELHDRVAASDEPGLLAYLDGEPVGWVSVAPRAHFTSLLRSTQFRPLDDDPDVWVVSCFIVDRRVRRSGLGTRLLAAAVAHARDHGATAVEGFPHEQPDYKGKLSTFLSLGFAPVRTVGRRTVVRHTLS